MEKNPFEEEIHFDNSIIQATETGGTLQKQTVSKSESSADNANVVSWWKSLTHPVATFFHCIFKFLALITYIFAYWFSDSFVVIFICCVVFLTFDFWVVKNVSGRLMVGLRWWNQINEDGSNDWIFESLEVKKKLITF